MIKHYCDICGEEIAEDCVMVTLKRESVPQKMEPFDGIVSRFVAVTDTEQFEICQMCAGKVKRMFARR